MRKGGGGGGHKKGGKNYNKEALNIPLDKKKHHHSCFMYPTGRNTATALNYTHQQALHVTLVHKSD